ncbi:MAG: hypothetical protein WC860_02390 [Candidatus Margulisiibacteriota bacterium]|jgi:hypothetical protein
MLTKNQNPEIIVINHDASFFSELFFDYFKKNQLTFNCIKYKDFTDYNFDNAVDYLIIMLNGANQEIKKLNTVLIKKKIVNNVFILSLAKKTFRKEDLLKISSFLYPLQIIYEPFPFWLLEEQLFKIIDFMNTKRGFLNKHPQLALSHIIQEERINLYQQLNTTLYHELRNALTPIYAGMQLINLIKNRFDEENQKKTENILAAAKELIEKINNLNHLIKDGLIS